MPREKRDTWIRAHYSWIRAIELPEAAAQEALDSTVPVRHIEAQKKAIEKRTAKYAQRNRGGLAPRHFESDENVIYDCGTTKVSSYLDLAGDFFIEDFILNPERTTHEYDTKIEITYINPNQDFRSQKFNDSKADETQEIDNVVATIPNRSRST